MAAGTKIRGITVEIGGDTTGLSKALKDVNSEIRSTQSQLKDVERLLKLDPSNTTLLAQKQRLLSESIDETKKKLEALKAVQDKAADAAKSGGKKEQEAYEAVQREIVATENKLKGLEKSQIEYAASSSVLGKVASEFENIGNKATNLSNKIMPLSIAAGAAGAAMVGTAVGAASAADDLNTLSKQTGISTEELQKFQYAADIVDVSMETMKGALGKMTGTLRTNQGAFEDLGIAVNDSSGQMRSRYDIFTDTVDALSKMSDETERDIKSQELFGRSFQELNPLIVDGTEALKALGKEYEDLDLDIDQETLDKANELNDTIDKLKRTFKATFTKVGAELAPIINDVLDGIQEKVASVGNAITQFIGNNPGLSKFILGLTGVVAAAAPALAIFGKMAEGINSALKPLSQLVSSLGGLSGVFSALTGPVGLIIGSLAVLAGAFTHLWQTNEEFRNKVTEIWDGIKSKFESFAQGFVEKVNQLGFDFSNITELMSAAWDAFCNLLAPVFEGVFNEIAIIFETVLDVISGILDVFVGLFTGNWEQMWNGIKDIFESLWNGIIKFFENVLNSIVEICTKIWDGIKSIFSGKAEDAKEYGEDTGKSYAEGLSNSTQLVAEAADKLAAEVAARLHHSTPDKGPMKDDDEWMPDMMKQFADGIENNIYLVKNAAEDAANAIAGKLGLDDQKTNVIKSIISIFDGLSSIKNTVSNAGSEIADAFLSALFGGLTGAQLGTLKTITSTLSSIAEQVLYPILSRPLEALAIAGAPMARESMKQSIVNVSFGNINWSGSNDIEKTMEMIGAITKHRGYRLGQN